MERDVIVIGSGVGGLTAALTCARAGRDVLVLEAGKQLGGFINPFARKKFWFDTGIHYVGELGPGQSLHNQFDRLGLFDYVSFRELDPNGFDRYVFPDYEVALCKGADRFKARLLRDFPAEASGLDNYFRLLQQVQVALSGVSRIKGPMSIIGLLPRLPTLLKYHRATYSQILDACFTDIRLKAALSGPGGDIGLPPGKASGLIMLALLAHFLGGAYFPVGGTKAVRDAYVSALDDCGAEMKRNTPVDRILTRNGKVTGVRTVAGDEHTAPIVISNADAVATLQEMLGAENTGRALRKKLARAEYSLGSICAFVGTDLQPTEHGVTDANIWHYPSCDIDSLYEPALAGKLGTELPFFLTVPTLKDPSGSHAPAGKHTVELISFAPWQRFERWQDQKTFKRDDDYKALKDQLGLALVERAETYLPGLRDHMEVHEFATPATNSSYVRTRNGSIYGLSHTPDQVGLGRFRTKGPVQGLFLCGADILGGGIATCATSGSMAGRMALARPSLASRALGKLAGIRRPRLAHATEP